MGIADPAQAWTRSRLHAYPAATDIWITRGSRRIPELIGMALARPLEAAVTAASVA